jgi:hypothetical protein
LWIAAATSGPLNGADAVVGDVTGPLRLEVEQEGNAGIVRLIGDSPVACSASYELEVGNSGGAGGNRSIHRGVARLQPGRPTTLVSVKFGTGDQRGWLARLSVQPCSGPDYQQIWHSAHQGRPIDE